MVPMNPMEAGMMAHARRRSIERTLEMHMALSTHRWTRADLDRLPNDGNKYEVIHGELLVSPAPRPAHQYLVEALRDLLVSYCERENLGRPSGIHAFVTEDSETLPDLLVRHRPFPPPDRWDDMPMPLLVAEVSSPSTRRYDEVKKRRFYIEAGIPEYWIVDGRARTIRVVTSSSDRIEANHLRWFPPGAANPLDIDVALFFLNTIGPDVTEPAKT